MLRLELKYNSKQLQNWGMTDQNDLFCAVNQHILSIAQEPLLRWNINITVQWTTVTVQPLCIVGDKVRWKRPRDTCRYFNNALYMFLNIICLTLFSFALLIWNIPCFLKKRCWKRKQVMLSLRTPVYRKHASWSSGSTEWVLNGWGRDVAER